MSDDSDSFSVNGDDSTGSLSDSGNHTNPADPTVPDPHARSRRFDFRGKIGNFLIHREIGRGGMGVVYEAIEEILNRRVALKVLPSGALIDEMQIRRFRNEAAAAAQLVHPNIVPVYSVGSDRGVHYYAMQLIDGQNIAEIIGSIRERISTEDKAKHNADTPRDIGTTQRETEAPAPAIKGSKDSSSRKQLMEDDFAAAVSHHRHPQNCQRLFKSIASIGCDAARAIHYAHDAGVVHRDIKPHNLMLDEKGKVWITDFGLAQVRDNPVGTRTGDILGTLKYMSPEQASGRKFLIDHRTDIYSLGITLYELLTLKPAHSGVGAKEILRQISFEDPQSLRLINPRIPAELETIIAKAIAKNPQERYETAADFAEDLERFCNDQPIAAKRPTVIQKARRWVIKYPTLAGMTGVGMVFTFLTSMVITGAMVNSNHTISMEREKAVSLLSKSEGWRLLTHSRLELPKNPGVGLALAMEGAKRVEGLEANLAVQDAFNASHEQYNFQPRKEATAKIEVANRSQRAVLTVDSRFVGKGNYPAIVIDLKDTKTLFQLDSGEAITSAAYSPNEEFLLTTSSRPTLPAGEEQAQSQVFAPIVWDAATGRRLSTFPQHAIPEVHTEMFSSDSANIVLPGPGNQASIYSTQAFGINAVLRGHNHPVVRAVYSPDGKWIATIDDSGEARFWTASDGQLVKSLQTQLDGKLYQFQFTNDSNRLLVASKTGTRVYSVHGESAEPTAFWRESRFIIVPQKDRCASYWDFGKVVEIRNLSDGRSILRIETQDHVTTVTFSSDGQYLVIGSGIQFSLHDAATGLKLGEFLGHTDNVTCARFNKTEGTIITSANDGTVRTWYPKSGWERYTFGSLSDGRGIANLAFSTDSRYLLSNSCVDFQTIMFDTNGNRINGNQHGELLSDHPLAGNLVLGNSAVSVIDPVTSRITVSRKFSGNSVRDVIPIGQTRSAIVRLNGDTAVLWNTATDEVTPLAKSGDQVVCYDVLADGTKFLVGTANGSCQLHDAANGAILRTILHPALVSSVRFLPVDQRIVTVDERSTIRIWGESELAAERTLAKENYFFTDCLISSNSKSLVSFHESKSQPICCWDIETGELRFETAGPRAPKVALHSSSNMAYCGSVASGLFAWNLGTGEKIEISPAPVLEIAILADRINTIEMPTSTNFENAESMMRPNKKASVIGVYSTQTNQRLMEIPAAEGLHRNRISVNETTQEFAVSTMVHSVKLIDRTNSDSVVWLGAHRAPI
ncbi:MAG: protein kinase, partial [Pirellulaceae bacterium]|nr:protein kinase [Pirellulaceae bacterium]